jgi:membrane protease YdiL (CAAX protease family)
MKTTKSKTRMVLAALVATFLFAAFLKADSLLQVANLLAESGWALPPILATVVAIRMAFAAIVVLAVFPLILDAQITRRQFFSWLRLDGRTVWLGLVSFAAFCTLAAAIALGMGIFRPDLVTVISQPDIRPDADVIGWGYFLLALVPAIWEELAFRGWIQSRLRAGFSVTGSVLLSALFFSLYHLSNLVSQAPSLALPGVVMALFFGIGWGYMTARSGSLVPVMIAHYLVDSLGNVFLNVDSGDPALAAGFFLLLTFLYPLFNILLTRFMYKKVNNDEIPNLIFQHR